MPHELLPRFFTAAFNGDTKEVQRLIGEAPSLIHEKDKTGEIVRSLITTDENRERIATNPHMVKEWTALHLAAFSGHVAAITALPGAAAELDMPDEAGLTPMHHAVSGGRVGAITALLDAGAKPDMPDKKGWTPMHNAAYRGHVATMTTLLRAGAKPDTPDKNGWTPMHHAASRGQVDAITALRAVGAKPDTPDNDGWTPMHMAAYCGDVGAITALLGVGAKPDMSDKNGWTPMHYAAYLGHVAVVATLANQGVAIDRKTITNLERALTECLETLRKSGSRDLEKRNQATIQAEQLVQFGVKVPKPKRADPAEGFIKHLQGIATDILPLRETRSGLRMSLLAADSLAISGGAGAGAMVSDVSDRGRMTVPPVRGK